MQVAFDPERPFHLQVGHVDLQVPGTVADDEPVGGHVAAGSAEDTIEVGGKGRRGPGGAKVSVVGKIRLGRPVNGGGTPVAWSARSLLRRTEKDGDGGGTR